MKLVQHPYDYSIDKTLKFRLIEAGVPVVLLLLFFIFYNFGEITPSEMVKTSGLLAISLLGVTLVIGPLTRLFPQLDNLKAYRKFWGILSFVIALVHVALVFIFYYKFSIWRFVDFSHPKYPGILSGLLALVILLLVTLTSNQRALTKLSPKQWKIIQTTSYLALFLAIVHFYLMETVDGVLIIKRVAGQITYVFSILVILARILILFLPGKK